MLRIPATLLAIIGSVLASLENISIVPIKNSFIELIILGRIPFTNYQITFEPLFILLVAATVAWLIRFGYRQAQASMLVMWDPEELGNISI